MEVKREQIVYVGNPHIKAKVVMLSTRKKAVVGDIVKPRYEEDFHILTKNDGKEYSNTVITQNLYIISDEEIKEGDWYIFDVGYASGVKQADLDDIENIHLEIDPKKIIATTDTLLGLPNPSQQFIEKYIEEYNKDNQITDVLVEVEVDYSINCGIKSDNCHKYMKNTVDYTNCNKAFYKLKIDPQNNITIRKQKDSWTREELPINDLKLIVETITKDSFKSRYLGENEKISLNNLNKWIKENL